MQTANNTLIKNVATQVGDDEYELYINVADKNYKVNDRLVESVTMYVTYEDGEVSYGDLAVNWQAEDDSNYTHKTQLIMRDVNDSNNNTATMGEFYWEHAFDDTLHSILLENGFSAKAVEDVSGSEWGMQDVGRASYDAYFIADEMLQAYNIKVAA